MIDIINIENGLPISVIVPLQEKRKYFFFQFVLPLIKANNPSEIIINSNEGGAAKKRNEGFEKSKNPFVLFSDDDILYPRDYMCTLYEKIKDDDSVGYAYTGYTGIVDNSEIHGVNSNFDIKTTEFDPELLKKGNYISTMALIKRSVFPYFDETIPRFIDYDLFLHMLSLGVVGREVYGTKFYAFFLDKGITSINNEYSHEDILKKYSF